MKCEGWCLPAIIYVVLAIISLLIVFMDDYVDSYNIKMSITVFHIIWAIFWTCILYMLCSYCHQDWAWIGLMIPFIFGLYILALGTAVILSILAAKETYYDFKNIKYNQAGKMYQYTNTHKYGDMKHDAMKYADLYGKDAMKYGTMEGQDAPMYDQEMMKYVMYDKNGQSGHDMSMAGKYGYSYYNQ